MHLDALFRAGIFPAVTVAEPGDQGAVVTGMQGMGVNTPSAAAVAAATVGFPRDEHIPKGRIFTIGLLSMIFATGILFTKTLFTGRTMSVLGVLPNEHFSVAPMTTSIAMSFLTRIFVRPLINTRYFARDEKNDQPWLLLTGRMNLSCKGECITNEFLPRIGI
jgi:hypothetical protein